MKRTDLVDRVLSLAREDDLFRKRLVANPKETIESQFNVKLLDEHSFFVHEDSEDVTHLVLPPRYKLSNAEREEARVGAASFEFLRKTMYDPAPPARSVSQEEVKTQRRKQSPSSVANTIRESISQALVFLDSTIDENGAWHCIRFNIADPSIPRHFERPPFVSALGALALQQCTDPRAHAISDATKAYLVETIEYPGLWRYYRHLPTDLDSTSLCSLLLPDHPWILFGRNIPHFLRNRDEHGRFMTWIQAENEPEVVAKFRLEADPVVNANAIAYLGDRPETHAAQQWLETLIVEDALSGISKWYPDVVSAYYAIARNMTSETCALSQLRSTVAERVLNLRNENGDFGNVLLNAQAISTLRNVDALSQIDVVSFVEMFLSSQREDGSWPELLAFGDQALQWGPIGQIGHGSESLTTAFCVEALEHLLAFLASSRM